jgi:hypothetical protein
LAVPGLEMVTVCELVTPTVTLEKATLAGTTEMAGCTPVPLRATVAGELVALLVTVMLPV